MPQRLKEDVRERILAAAASVFAEKGFEAARMSDVARRGGVTTSNIYKYFDSKQALFDVIVTPPLVAELLRLLRRRARDLGTMEAWTQADAQGSPSAAALLNFWISNRFTVVILIRGAGGTRYAHVRALMIAEMERLALAHLRTRQGGDQPDPEMRFIVRQVFVHTFETIADILLTHDDSASIHNAFALFWRYQLAGLQALLDRPAVRPR